MGIFSSDYQNRMFEPFVREFIEGFKDGFSNPYQSFYERGETINFPYPPVMLLIMSLSEGLCMLIPDAPLFVHNFIFKLPLLAIDCMVFIIMCRLYPDKRINVVLAYFMSPVIIYATYMHSQLDIVPMSLLFLSLLFLTGTNSKKRFFLSAIFLSLALLSKFHIAAVLPLIAIYIYKHRGLIYSAVYCFSALLMTALCILPFYGDGFVNGVILNSAQSSLFVLYFSYGDLRLYLSLAALVVIYLYSMNLNFINSELLFGLGGLIFSVFLALCAPMPGWYMWVMLFLADFIIRADGYRHCGLCYTLLQLLYLVFFIFFHQSANGAVDLYFFDTDCSFLKLSEPVIGNVFFSLLSATMIYMIWLMHKFCIAGNSLYHFHDTSFVIGICGDSGTGKSTLQDSISNIFGAEKLLCIEGDGDHKWERGDTNWDSYTHLNPQANYLYRQARDIRQLKDGKIVKRVDYDHNTGHFTSKRTVLPCRFISISGLHILFLPQLRDIIDLKIYTEADEELRISWKMSRDVGSRGHTREDIVRQIQSRYEDARKFIFPQKEFADIIIHYFMDGDDSDNAGMRIKISTKVDMEDVVSALENEGVTISYELSEDFRYQILIYRPSLNQETGPIDFSRLFSRIFTHRNDIITDTFSAEDTADCIRKLTLVKAISSKLRGEI